MSYKLKRLLPRHRKVLELCLEGMMTYKQILKPFLRRKIEAYCFSPAEAMALMRAERTRNRKTPASCGNRPGTNRKANPQLTLGDRYDTVSYGKAVKRAVKRAMKDDDKLPEWHPHQLRHAAATHVRREMGLDAARAYLGHRGLAIANDYAELDQALALEVARKYG